MVRTFFALLLVHCTHRKPANWKGLCFTIYTQLMISTAAARAAIVHRNTLNFHTSDQRSFATNAIQHSQVTCFAVQYLRSWCTAQCTDNSLIHSSVPSMTHIFFIRASYSFMSSGVMHTYVLSKDILLVLKYRWTVTAVFTDTVHTFILDLQLMRSFVLASIIT